MFKCIYFFSSYAKKVKVVIFNCILSFGPDKILDSLFLVSLELDVMKAPELIFQRIILFDEKVILLGFELDFVAEELDLIFDFFEFETDVLFAGPDGFKVFLLLFVKSRKFLIFLFFGFIQKLELF